MCVFLFSCPFLFPLFFVNNTKVKLTHVQLLSLTFWKKHCGCELNEICSVSGRFLFFFLDKKKITSVISNLWSAAFPKTPPDTCNAETADWCDCSGTVCPARTEPCLPNYIRESLRVLKSQLHHFYFFPIRCALPAGDCVLEEKKKSAVGMKMKVCNQLGLIQKTGKKREMLIVMSSSGISQHSVMFIFFKGNVSHLNMLYMNKSIGTPERPTSILFFLRLLSQRWNHTTVQDELCML